MLEIIEYNVYGLEEAAIASGLPMSVNTSVLTPNTDRLKRLGGAISGSGHDSALKGVLVRARVKYPLYWTKQFQRYHFADIVSSQSTMHRITKMNLDECFNKYTSKSVIEIVKSLVEIYNWMIDNNVDNVYLDDNEHFHITKPDSGEFETCSKYNIFMRIISTCPSGLEMEMEIVTNYLQLKTIYEQRQHHKLKEDWGHFCEWIKGLPLLCDILEGGR